MHVEVLGDARHLVERAAVGGLKLYADVLQHFQAAVHRLVVIDAQQPAARHGL